jgi:lyso-ornithine lipid O-acyltransferase
MKAITTEWLRATVKIILILATILVGLLLVMLIIPIAGWCGPTVQRRVRNTSVRTWSHLVCRIINLKINQTGSKALRTTLSISNHISWIDIIALASKCDFVFVAKREVQDWPVLGKLFKGTGTLFIERGNPQSSEELIGDMAHHLASGISLMLFPEATTTGGEVVRRFSSKLIKPAIEAKSLIQPIAIRYEGASKMMAPFVGSDTFVPHLWRILKEKEVNITLCFGAPIRAASRGKEELTRELHHEVSRLFDSTVAVNEEALLQNRHTPFTPLSH